MKAVLATDQVNRVLIETSNGTVEMCPVLVIGYAVSKPSALVAQDALNIVMIGDETELAALITASMQLFSKGEALIGELAEALYGGRSASGVQNKEAHYQ